MNKNVYINARFLSQPITGTQRFAIELCRGIKNIIPTAIFIAPDNIIHQDIADELNVQIVGRLKKGILWEQIELPLYLNRIGRPLLVNLCNVAPVFYSNSIVSVLDLSFYLHPEWFSKTFTILYNSIIPRAAKRARRVVTISENSRHDIATNFKVDSKNIDIVYPSISSIFLNPVNTPYTNPYGRYVLAVSSLDPRKNFKGLIAAFKELNLPDIKLVIVGSEHKVFADDDLKGLVGSADNIIFTGYISDDELVSLYHHAALFAYPSFFEGFGIPPLEAMACGCPTIVANTTSLPEVCEDASVYVDPYDINSIRDGLLEVLTNETLRQNLIQKGFERVKYFEQQSSAQKMADIINKLI